MKRDESYPMSYILQVTREDGDEQNEIDHLMCEAANLIFDLVERARAFDEALPHGYLVKRVRPRTPRGATPRSPRLELRYIPRTFFGQGSEYKVAERDDAGTRLNQSSQFEKHLNTALLSEIGAYFVRRLHDTQQQRRTLEHSLRDINHLRHLLLEDSTPEPPA